MLCDRSGHHPTGPPGKNLTIRNHQGAHGAQELLETHFPFRCNPFAYLRCVLSSTERLEHVPALGWAWNMEQDQTWGSVHGEEGGIQRKVQAPEMVLVAVPRTTRCTRHDTGTQPTLLGTYRGGKKHAR